MVSPCQLSKLASKMGAEWKQFGVEQLGMTKTDIDHCVLSDPQGRLYDHIFAMLDKWKSRCGMSASVNKLLGKLEEFGANEECGACLK